MKKDLSVYLDAMRITAAFMVFLAHLSYERFFNGFFSFLPNYGHDAVMVFFVLSGYVISYVSKSRERTLVDYGTSRLSRLYSVLVPAILLTIVADLIGRSFDEELYHGVYADSFPLIRVVVNALFLQEIWGSGIRLFSNGPFWSLSYEFFYYLIFAMFFYLRGFCRYFLGLFPWLLPAPKY